MKSPVFTRDIWYSSGNEEGLDDTGTKRQRHKGTKDYVARRFIGMKKRHKVTKAQRGKDCVARRFIGNARPDESGSYDQKDQAVTNDRVIARSIATRQSHTCGIGIKD